jgi:membrane protein
MAQDITASNSRFYYRVVSLAIAVALLVIILYEQLHDFRRHQHLIRDQFELTVRMLAQQVALSSQQALQDKNIAALAKLVNNLASDPYILDASIYDAKGIPLARSEGALPYEQLGGFGEFREQPGRPDLLFILGYMRLTLEQKTLLLRTGEMIESEYQRGHVMLLFATLSGFLLAIALLPIHGITSRKASSGNQR